MMWNPLREKMLKVTPLLNEPSMGTNVYEVKPPPLRNMFYKKENE